MSGGGGGRDDGFGVTVPSIPTRSDPVGPGGSGQVGGSDGGATGGGGGGGIDVVDVCDVVQRAPLNSVKAAASALRVGDDLEVFLDASGARPILAVRDRHGQVVGSLTHRGHLVLIQCIGQGRTYGAVVTSVSGAAIELRVQLA